MNNSVYNESNNRRYNRQNVGMSLTKYKEMLKIMEDKIKETPLHNNYSSITYYADTLGMYKYLGGKEDIRERIYSIDAFKDTGNLKRNEIIKYIIDEANASIIFYCILHECNKITLGNKDLYTYIDGVLYHSNVRLERILGINVRRNGNSIDVYSKQGVSSYMMCKCINTDELIDAVCNSICKSCNVSSKGKTHDYYSIILGRR